MSYTGTIRPTLSEIESRVLSDISSYLPSQDARLRHSPLNVLAQALIGASHEMYGYINWAVDQTSVLYCEKENLDLFGSIWNFHRKPSNRATGALSITGIDGSEVPLGTEFEALDGVKAVSTSTATVASGVAVVPIQSIEASSIVNKSAGVLFNLTSTLSGLASQGSVISLTGGADIESDEAYRARLLTRIQKPPQGGSKQDYITWALSQPNVTRAWVTTPVGSTNEVFVWFATDETSINGIPSVGDVSNLQAFIDDVRPVTADVSVVAPVAQVVNITITNLTPNTPSTQAAVIAELKDMLRVRGELGTSFYLSWLWEAVSLATGNQHHRITTPATDVTVSSNALPVLGTVTFV